MVSNASFKSDLLQSPAEGMAKREREQAAKSKGCLTSSTALSSYSILKLPDLTEKKPKNSIPGTRTGLTMFCKSCPSTM